MGHIRDTIDRVRSQAEREQALAEHYSQTAIMHAYRADQENQRVLALNAHLLINNLGTLALNATKRTGTGRRLKLEHFELMDLEGAPLDPYDLKNELAELSTTPEFQQVVNHALQYPGGRVTLDIRTYAEKA